MKEIIKEIFVCSFFIAAGFFCFASIWLWIEKENKKSKDMSKRDK